MAVYLFLQSIPIDISSPLFAQVSVGGIIMLRDTDAGEPEELIEPLKGKVSPTIYILALPYTCCHYLTHVATTLHMYLLITDSIYCTYQNWYGHCCGYLLGPVYAFCPFNIDTAITSLASSRCVATFYCPLRVSCECTFYDWVMVTCISPWRLSDLC